jgi:hypothetical protein
LINPILWTALHHQHSSDIPGCRLAITHGDLHGDNIFTDGHSVWIFDFERSGYGPILRDFVELEVDILTRLLRPAVVSETQYLKFIIQLYSSRHLKIEPEKLASLKLTPEYTKALMVVKKLRLLAEQVTGYTDFREYLWGVLLDAVYVACWKPSEENREAQEIQIRLAKILGSAICYKLESGSSNWVPRKIKEFLDTLPGDLPASSKTAPPPKPKTQDIIR